MTELEHSSKRAFNAAAAAENKVKDLPGHLQEVGENQVAILKAQLQQVFTAACPHRSWESFTGGTVPQRENYCHQSHSSTALFLCMCRELMCPWIRRSSKGSWRSSDSRRKTTRSMRSRISSRRTPLLLFTSTLGWSQHGCGIYSLAHI